VGTGRDKVVMVTGGAGYIGTHAVLRLVREGWEVVVVDRMIPGRANPSGLNAIERAEPSAATRLHVAHVDISDGPAVRRVFEEHGCTSVLHFAGLAYVAESVGKPVEYYVENVAKGIRFIEAAVGCGVKRLVVSSSCTVYGEPDASRLPVREGDDMRPTHAYGTSKWMLERIVRHTVDAHGAAGLGACCLRYFNVAGCDRTGLLGEVHDPETHVIPIILRCLAGEWPGTNNVFFITGDDFPTPDGTAVRDYVHVDDVVDAHVKALGAIRAGRTLAYNLGLGKGISIRELIAACERVTGRKLDVRVGPRRPGDAPMLWADASLARSELGWSPAVTTVEEMVDSAWRWMQRRP